jgi:uncharacterized protein YdeI (YjbR/CyaY-like superfamily)
MITEIEDFFTKGCGRCDRFATPDCSTRLWIGGLEELRRLCLAAGLTEMVKWGHPCYILAGRNIVIFGAFRGDFRLTFFNAALMKDPEGVLTGQGPHSQHPDCIRFNDNAQVALMAPVISAYLAEAMGYAQAGVLPVKEVREIELPDALVEALDMDPELAEAFAALTPGRQRSYVLNLAGAKAAATKVARIARFRGHILAGKGALER